MQSQIKEKISDVLHKLPKKTLLILAQMNKLESDKKPDLIDKLILVLIKNSNFIDYVVLAEEFSKARVSKKLFIEEIEKINEKISGFDLVNRNSWYGRITPCFILKIHLDKLKDILNKCAIKTKKISNKYSIVGEKLNIKEINLIAFLSEYNRKHSYKLLAEVKELNNEVVRIFMNNDTGLRRITYFSDDFHSVSSETFRIALPHSLYFFKENDNFYFTTNLNLKRIEYSNLILALLNLVFSQKVEYKKDLVDEIKQFELKVKKHKDLIKIEKSIETVKVDLINKITNDTSIKKDEKQELLTLAKSIKFTGVYAHNLNKIHIKKYLLEGDIECLKTDKPDFFKQIDTVIKESKDYELMIDINSKTFGIVNGEYKKPLGQLKKAEFILFEMMVRD